MKACQGLSRTVTIIATVRRFPYKRILASGTSTCINTSSSDFFPEGMVTLDIESTNTCWLIMLVLLIIHWFDYRDDTILHVFCMYLMHLINARLCKLFTVLLYGFKPSHNPFQSAYY